MGGLRRAARMTRTNVGSPKGRESLWGSRTRSALLTSVDRQSSMVKHDHQCLLEKGPTGPLTTCSARGDRARMIVILRRQLTRTGRNSSEQRSTSLESWSRP